MPTVLSHSLEFSTLVQNAFGTNGVYKKEEPTILRSMDGTRRILNAKIRVVTRTKKLFYGNGLFKVSGQRKDPTPCRFLGKIDPSTGWVDVFVKVEK